MPYVFHCRGFATDPPRSRYNAQVLFMRDQWLPYLRDAHASAYLSSTVDGPSHLDAVYTPVNPHTLHSLPPTYLPICQVPASLPDSWSHPFGFNTTQQPSTMQQPSTVQQSLRQTILKMAFNSNTATQPVQSVQQPMMGMAFNSSTATQPVQSVQQPMMGMAFNSSTGKRPHISAQVVAQVRYYHLRAASILAAVVSAALDS